MLFTIIAGIIAFCFFAAVINSGFNQMKAHQESILKAKIARYYNTIRDREILMETLPGRYLPVAVRYLFAVDILHQLGHILRLNPGEARAKSLHMSYSQLIEELKTGQYTDTDERKSQSLSETQAIHNMIRQISNFLKAKATHGQLSSTELGEAHQQLEASFVKANIDGEIGQAQAAMENDRLQSAYYHFNRVYDNLLKYNDDGQYDIDIPFVETQMEVIKTQLEESGQKLHNPRENDSPLMNDKKWDTLMAEEAQFSSPKK